MKPKAKLSSVTARDVNNALPDLHYTAVATLPVIDAVLLCLGLLDVYEANIQLTPRRNGQKLYVRAASNFTEKQYADFVTEDTELSVALNRHLKALADRAFAQSKGAKVIFRDFKTYNGDLWLPMDCIIGSIVPRTKGKDLREWYISSPVLLDTFYSVPSKGGIYFLRELPEELQKEQRNGNGNT